MGVVGSGLALCSRGTLGKGTLRTYPSWRVPTTIIPTSAPLASPASAWIWRQQGPAIVGDAADDIFASVALSADAKTLAVGAPGPLYGSTDEKMGYVKV